MKKLVLVLLMCFLVVSLAADEAPWQKEHPLIDATVLVGNLKARGMGTGFFIDETGYILTAAHVVSDHGTTVVVFPDPPFYQTARIVYTDRLNDWAILKVSQLRASTATWVEETKCFTYEPIPFSFLKPGSLEDIELGDDLMYCGHPAAIGWLISKGTLLAVKYDSNGRQYIFSNIAGYPGASGSALVDSNNLVVGLLQMGLPGLGGIGIATEDIMAIAKVVILEDLRLAPKQEWLAAQSARAKAEWELLVERTEQ